MTKQEWLECTDPTPMMELLRGNASGRKFRLFACACWRREWRCLPMKDRNAVVVAERFADGLVSVDELPEAFDEEGRDAWPYVTRQPLMALTMPTWLRICLLVQLLTRWMMGTMPSSPSGKYSELVREVFGLLPYGCISIDTAWLSSTVSDLASTIYNEHAFDRLPILADTLEKAGCTNADILNHCRQPREHVRGCWVVDLILGKQ